MFTSTQMLMIITFCPPRYLLLIQASSFYTHLLNEILKMGEVEDVFFFN